MTTNTQNLQRDTQSNDPKSRWFRFLAYGYELIKIVLIFVVLVLIVHFSIATIFKISGSSMEPNFFDGEFVLVDKLSYILNEPQRGDVVILSFPADPQNRKFIKRIIGLPGENVAILNGQIQINNKPLNEFYLPRGVVTEPTLTRTLRQDEYFIAGDNRPNSNDSRFFGPVPRLYLIGKVRIVLKGAILNWVAQPVQ